AVATVARVSPMANHSFSSCRGPPGAFACSLAGLQRNRSPSTPAGMPHQAAFPALAALPADLPAQALLDDSRTVSISSSDEHDDGLPSPSGAAAVAAIEAFHSGGSPHYAAHRHGVSASLRDLQRQNAEEAAFIRGTLAALKQATLAGFEDFGEVEVLPGLPRIRSSHSSYGRGFAVSVTTAATNVDRSQTSVASGGPASRLCLTLNAVVHGANLAAIFGGGGGAAAATASASVSTMLQPLQTSTQTGRGFSADYLTAKPPAVRPSAVPSSQQIVRAMVDAGEVYGMPHGSPPEVLWENSAPSPPWPAGTGPAEESPRGDSVGGREGFRSQDMMAGLPKVPPLPLPQSHHPPQPLRQQQSPIAGPPLISQEQLKPSASGLPSPPLHGVGLPPPPPFQPSPWPQQQAAGHRYAEILHRIFAQATAAQQQLRQQQQQQQQQQLQQLYNAHRRADQPHQLRLNQPPAQQPQPPRQNEQQQRGASSLPGVLEPPGAPAMSVIGDDVPLQLQEPTPSKHPPLPEDIRSGQSVSHECVNVSSMSPRSLLKIDAAAREGSPLQNGEDAQFNKDWNHAISCTNVSAPDCVGRMSSPDSSASFTIQADVMGLPGDIATNKDHICKATSLHHVTADGSARVGGQGASKAGHSTSSAEPSKLSTADATLDGGSADGRSADVRSAGSGSAAADVAGGDSAEGCGIADSKSHGISVEALAASVNVSEETNSALQFTVTPLPPAATAAEAEVTAFARQLPSEQRKELAQLVREKWSPFTFPQLFPAKSSIERPAAAAPAAEVLGGSSQRVLAALPAVLAAVGADAAAASGICSSSRGAATSRLADASFAPILSDVPAWKASARPQSIGSPHSLSTSGAGSYYRGTGGRLTFGTSTAASPQTPGSKGASQRPLPRAGVGSISSVCGGSLESSCMTGPSHAGLPSLPMHYHSAGSSVSSVIYSLNAMAVSTETSVRACDSGFSRDAAQRPTLEPQQDARCVVSEESVIMALPQSPALPPAPQRAAAAVAAGAGLGPPLTYQNREQQESYAMAVDSTIAPTALVGPAGSVVTTTSVAATASVAVAAAAPQQLSPLGTVTEPPSDPPAAAKAPAAVQGLSGVDMDYVRSLVGRKWSPFFDLEASLRPLKAPLLAAPSALPDTALDMAGHKVCMDMQSYHGRAPSAMPLLTEPYAAHDQPYVPQKAEALRVATKWQPRDRGSGTLAAIDATAMEVAATTATGAVTAATATAPSAAAPAPAPGADVLPERKTTR
ncbi:hypothetical protein VaNZ11_016657, partial [Volvox africanus]